MLSCVATALLPEPDPDEAERDRRDLLRSADQLLNQVEALRLKELGLVPDSLGSALAALAARLGRSAAQDRLRTVSAAHHLVFALQQRLMSGNPRNPNPRSHSGRASGSPQLTVIANSKRWKLLALPPRVGSSEEDAEHWKEVVWATVDRARERWIYAQRTAVAAAMGGAGRSEARAAAEAMSAAWSNYFELLLEAEKITGESAPELPLPLSR